MCCVEIQRAADLVKVPRRFGEGLSLWPTPSPLIRPYNDVERYFCGEGPRIFYRPSPKRQSCESLPAGYRGKWPTLRDFACRVPVKMAYPAGFCLQGTGENGLPCGKGFPVISARAPEEAAGA